MMRELLEKWTQLEPERCQTHPTTDQVQVRRAGHYQWTEDRAIILAATIEAIEDKGLGWALVRAEEAGEINAAVQTEDGRSEAIDFTPAEALLTAYLAALEAEGAS